MTSKLTITDGRVISVIERLEHYASNLKWTDVRGAQDLLTAADGLRELQERRKADSEPVAEVYQTPNVGICAALGPSIRMLCALEPGTKLYRHAQPAPEKYNIGDATMRHIFTPTGMTNVSDMQAVFDRVEAVLVGMEQPAPVVPDFKKLARELVDNLVDCGGLDEGVKEKYLEWAEKTCRAAMLVSAPQEAQVVPEKIEQSRKRVDRCDVCTEGARGGCGTCIFNGNFE
ncbi:hypothetical protein [Klebsiella variicola]|uniref:hypothetical protein n=1 Tax=Klebsiella variicola TaxID=244366 RepID=UPI001255048C|nr:hypothetical protein [Klebsiella variicola]VAS30328.1 Uncharacterised protein [Klebsiella variicola]